MAVSTATVAWRVALFATFLGVAGVALSLGASRARVTRHTRSHGRTLGLGIPPAVRNPADTLVETGNITWTLQWLTQSNVTTYQVYLRQSGGAKWLIAVFPPPPIFPVAMNSGATTYTIYMTLTTPQLGSILYAGRNLWPVGFTPNGTWALTPTPLPNAVGYPTAYGDGGWYFYLTTNDATPYNLTITRPLELCTSTMRAS